MLLQPFAVVSKVCAIIARRSSTVSGGLLISRVRQPYAALVRQEAKPKSGGAMTFYDPTLYGRDDEEEFGDSGAYSESLEEDFEEEEEEEEEPGGSVPEAIEPEPVAAPAPPAPPKPAAPSGGGGRGA